MPFKIQKKLWPIVTINLEKTSVPLIKGYLLNTCRPTQDAYEGAVNYFSRNLAEEEKGMEGNFWT